jgi:hypothetical protein
MSRPRTVPVYHLHCQSGQAVITFTDPSGRRTDVLHGAHVEPASRKEYARLVGEWEANNQRLEAKKLEQNLTVNELALRF